jgi:hypothetical protein
VSRLADRLSTPGHCPTYRLAQDIPNTRGGSGIFLQGPFRPAVSESQLVGLGQTIVGRGVLGARGGLEVQYASDGLRWTQRHYALPGGFVITAQAPSGDEASTIRAAEWLASERLEVAVD